MWNTSLNITDTGEQSQLFWVSAATELKLKTTRSHINVSYRKCFFCQADVTRMKQISEKQFLLRVKRKRGWWIRFWLSEKKSNTFLLFKGGKVVNALFARVGGNSRSESVKRWFRLGVRCVWTLYNILWIQLNLAHGKHSNLCLRLKQNCPVKS